MRYRQICEGVFRKRLNRFVAICEVDGVECECHVKNTGRLGELLLPGAKAALCRAQGEKRKTAFDLVAVQSANQWVNIDSQVVNRVFEEWVQSGAPFGSGVKIRREVKKGDSRLDFYLEAGERRIFCEVKGVTLLKEGVALFPDAPTLRGVRHLGELTRAVQEGYEACAVFVVAMKGARAVLPNSAAHPEFAQALWAAEAAGVRLMAVDCVVQADGIWADQPLPVEKQEK